MFESYETTKGLINKNGFMDGLAEIAELYPSLSKIGGQADILFEEIAFLQNREKELIISQEKRIEESNKQQGWANGIGLGDGLDASELNNVRGEITAAQKVFDRKRCILSNSNTKDN